MLNWLRFGAVAMFLARAYEYIRWGGPFRDIFYHPQGFGGWYAELMDTPLHELLSDPFYESALDWFSDGIGVLFILTALMLLFYEKVSKLSWILWVSSAFLLLHYYGLLYHKNLVQYGIFFEHAAQFVIPWCFVFFAEKKEKLAVLICVIGASITYFSHALYAIGYYPQPGHFVDMMIAGFGMTEDVAREALVHIGYLDIVFAFLVLLTPWVYEKKGLRFLMTVNIWYGILWGALTALARTYTSYTSGMVLHWLDQHMFQTIVRVPHFVVPLVVAIYYQLNFKRLQ
jgi:hypothetical protein